MAIDINKVRAKLSQLQTKGKKNADGTFEKTDFKKIYWKPKLGKQVIRLVPFKTNPSEPVQEVFYHNDIVKKKVLSLINFGEQDPIVNFANDLKKSDDKDDRDTGYKLYPKARYLAQIVVRGEEHLGTRLWEFSKSTYKALLAIIADEDYGDILDVNDGRDITVEGVEAVFGEKNTKYIEPNLLPKPKTTPLASKEEEIKSFLNNQYDPLQLTKKYSYEELLDFLKAWINPEEQVDSSSVKSEVAEENVEGAVEQETVIVEGDEDVDAGDVDIDEPPFVEDAEVIEEAPVVSTAKSAIAAASKRIIAKNNAEMQKKAEPKVKEEKPKVKATEKASESNKEKFKKLFDK